MTLDDIIHVIDLYIAIINRIGITALIMLTALMFFDSDDEEKLKKHKENYYWLIAGLVLNNALGFFVRYMLKNRM